VVVQSATIFGQPAGRVRANAGRATVGMIIP
jgi:hypothetical protein